MTTATTDIAPPDFRVHNRIGHSQAVLTRAESLPDHMGDDLWAVIARERSGFDLIPQRHFSEQFGRFADQRRRASANLPGSIRVYRGPDTLTEVALFWTKDIEVARSFPVDRRGICSPNPVIYALDVALSDIALAIHERQEKEIALFQITEDIMDAIEVMEWWPSQPDIMIIQPDFATAIYRSEGGSCFHVDHLDRSFSQNQLEPVALNRPHTLRL